MPFNSATLSAGIMQKLVVVAKEFMVAMEQRENQNNLPRAIAQNTSAESPVKRGNAYSIDVVIDTSEDAAPMAGAYEWGSGVHRTKGTPGLYPIEAKNAEELHFYWEERQKWFIGVRLPYGHPGVEAKPYIKPTLEESKDEIKRTLGREFKAQILSQTPKVTVINAT